MTALVWTPCVFFWILIPLELYNLKTTKYFNIPWGYLNISKLILVGLLTILSFIDLGMAVDMQESQGLFSVHIVSPIVKVVTFVSLFNYIICKKNLTFFQRSLQVF